MYQIVAEESRADSRVVSQDRQFIVIHSFAASRQVETWVIPIEHQPSYAQASGEVVTGLGSILLRTLKMLATAFNDPDFNYVLHSSPKSAEGHALQYCHWYIQIIPRMTTAAGFDLASDISSIPCPRANRSRDARAPGTFISFLQTRHHIITPTSLAASTL